MFTVQRVNVKRSNVKTLEHEYYATAAYNTLLFSELERILASPVTVSSGSYLPNAFLYTLSISNREKMEDPFFLHLPLGGYDWGRIKLSVVDVGVTNADKW